ncbi:MAG: sialidase family protein, partial [Ignavibacteriae bacterium]|nr:sialidase family protein [Ignavibacteriota bacterium]
MIKIISFYLFLLFLLIVPVISYSQYPPPSSNFRIFPSTITQTEPIVCISPLNRNIMFASSRTIKPPLYSEGIYVSTNGGYNWFGSDTCKGQSLQNHGGDPGVSIDKNGVFILTHIGLSFAGVYSHYSTDMGVNWSNAYTITNQQPEDKGTSTTDNSLTSPYYGRTYAAWVNQNASTPPVLFSFTSNSGTSWSAPQTINAPPPNRCSGGYLETGIDGTIYVCWAGVSNVYPFPSNYAGFSYSTNGGTNWTVYQNMYSINGIEPTLVNKGNMRVNSIPRFDIDKTGGPRNGWIYMVSAERGTGADSADIIMHRSTNNGLNWSAGIRVNQDPHNTGKTQYCPAISVDSTGAVNILFFDDRNTSTDSTDIFLARS